MSYHRNVIVALCATCVAAVAGAQAPQQITVTATVVTFDGQPLVGVPLILHTSGSSEDVTLTDQNGLATWAAEVAPEVVRVVIQVTGGGHDEFPSNEQRQISLHMRDLSEQYHFDLFTPVTIDPAVNAYTVTITAHEVVQATGTLVDGAGAPVEGLISSAPGFTWPTLSTADGSFVAKGLKREALARLFFYTAGAGQVFPMRLTAQQTAADVDVGQVVLTPTPPNPFVVDPTAGQLTLEMTNGDAANEASIARLSRVTLISTDGSTMYEFISVQGETEEVSVLRSGVVSIAAGSYYTIPGASHTALTGALLDAIESGADLSNSGIPTVTLADGQHVETTLDMLAAYQAIEAALGPLY